MAIMIRVPDNTILTDISFLDKLFYEYRITLREFCMISLYSDLILKCSYRHYLIKRDEKHENGVCFFYVLT